MAFFVRELRIIFILRNNELKFKYSLFANEIFSLKYSFPIQFSGESALFDGIDSEIKFIYLLVVFIKNKK